MAIEPTDNWSAKDEITQDERLTKGGSKKILTTLKRYEIKQQLKNPNTAPFGETKANKLHQSNVKLKSKKYELQDSQVYRKEHHDTRLGEIIPATYVICYNDAFEILTTMHEKLMHAGKLPICPPSLSQANFTIGFNTIFNH